MSDRKRDVFSLTEPVELRFKVDGKARHLPSQSRGSALSSIIAFVSRKKNASFDSTVKTETEPPLKLRFVEKLSSECIVVGNERCLDILALSFLEEGNIDVRLIDRITCNFQIRQVEVERKKCAIYVVGQTTIQIYVVDLKKETYYQQSSYQTQLPISQLRPYNDATMFVFHDEHALVFSTENRQILRREEIEYKKPKNVGALKVLSVPRTKQKFLNVFLYDPGQFVEDSPMFSLYKMQISQEGLEFRPTSVVEVQKINVDYFKSIKLHNYDRDTFLINLPAQVLVIKKHYPIDRGELNIRTENTRLLFLENNNLLHVNDTRVEAHSLKVLDNSISIRSFDCINLTRPEGSKLLTALPLSDDGFLLLFEPAKPKSLRETKYWLIGTVKSSIKTKLKELMSRTSDQHEIHEIAEKMGMSRCEIFLELWQQSKKNRKEDFDILLETQDYRTIISQLKGALRKECLSFKQIERIEKACLKMLERQMLSNPTESVIRNYIKSDFLARKYEVELQIKGRAMKIRMSKLVTEEQQERLVIGIQQFQDIRRRHVIKYLVEQMKKKDPQSLSIMKSYIDGFKMVLRAIYKEFLREIITQLSSENLLFLIKVYGEILPKKDDITQEYNMKSGVWSNITSMEWSKTLLFEKVQNIDNVKILHEMMGKDWFRWDWLVKHDFMNLKQHAFEQKFLEDRQEKIYYVFFDLLFNILKHDDPNLPLIVQKVEEGYEIPKHLVGHIFLYWELHKFFSQRDVLPGYQLRFEEFLPLKEDEIYRLVFSNENRNCKRLILTSIKDIYTATTRKQVYDESILTYFKASYSTIADLKYLLNRINNQKMEFHEENQNLYRILVEAIYYKLRWENGQQPPIQDILVYFESIPMSNDELSKLQEVQKVQDKADLLRDLNLNCNLKEFFHDGTEVLKKLAELELSNKPGEPLKMELQEGENGISFISIVNKLMNLRDNLFKDAISNQTVLETMISLAMNYDELVPDVERLIKENDLLSQFNVVDPLQFMERIVNEKVMKAYESKPVFSENEPFVRSLLKILPEESPKRKELQAHLDLGLLLSVLNNPPKAPLIISSRFIEKILSKQKVSMVNNLDIDLIYELMRSMGCTEGISSLYEVLILKYMEEGEWEQAINYITMWNQQNGERSVVFSALLINKIGEELSKDLKNNLVEIIIIKYHKPNELLEIAREIINCEEIKKRKELITSIVLENEVSLGDLLQTNLLLSEQFKVKEQPEKMREIKELYDQIRKGDVQLQRKDIYYLYYRLLLCEPIRAHEFHSKYFEEFDITRIEAIFLDISKRECGIFNQMECILFFYKSLLSLFASNYLGIEFSKLEQFFEMSFDDIEMKYPGVLEELPKEMSRLGEKQKYIIFKQFRRTYIKRRDNVDDYSVEAQEEDGESERMNEFKRIAEKTKMYSKMQTKKTIGPLKFIEPITPMHAEEENDFVESSEIWRNALNKHGGVDLRPAHGVTSSVRYKPKIRDLSEEKDSGHDNYSRHSLDIKHSDSVGDNIEPYSSKLKGDKKEEVKESLSEFNRNLEANQLSTPEMSSQVQNPAQKEPKKPLYRTFGQTSIMKARISKQNSREFSPVKEIPGTNEEIPSTVYYEKREKLTQSRSIDAKDQSLKSSPSKNVAESIPVIESEPKSQEQLEVKPAPESPSERIDQEELGARQIVSNEQIISTSAINDSPNVRDSRTKEEASPSKEVIVEQPQLEPEQPNPPSQRIQSRPISRTSRPSSRPASRERSQEEDQQEVKRSIEVGSITSSQVRRYMEESTPADQIVNLESSIVTTRQTQQPSEEKPVVEQTATEQLIDERTRSIVDAIVNEKDFSLLQQELPKHSGNQLAYLQGIVHIVFTEAPFKTFLDTVEKLKTINIKYQSAVRPQNIRVMRNAFKADLKYDLRLLFTPEVLYLSSGPNVDIETNNKLIFDSLKPRIKELVNDTNVFVISKLMSLSFNFNKSFEFRVQYYYLEGLMRNYLSSSSQLQEEETKMHLEKIDALFSRLPINMTAQRFGKMMEPLKGLNSQAFLKLLQTFDAILERKKETADGVKFQKEIEECQSEVAKLIEETS